MNQDAKLDILRSVASMLNESRKLSNVVDEHLLTYLIDMASIEAEARAETIQSSVQSRRGR